MNYAEMFLARSSVFKFVSYARSLCGICSCSARRPEKSFTGIVNEFSGLLELVNNGAPRVSEVFLFSKRTDGIM